MLATFRLGKLVTLMPSETGYSSVCDIASILGYSLVQNVLFNIANGQDDLLRHARASEQLELCKVTAAVFSSVLLDNKHNADEKVTPLSFDGFPLGARLRQFNFHTQINSVLSYNFIVLLLSFNYFDVIGHRAYSFDWEIKELSGVAETAMCCGLFTHGTYVPSIFSQTQIGPKSSS